MAPENIVFGWDISVRVVARRRTVYPSRWLREVGRDASNWTGLGRDGQEGVDLGGNTCRTGDNGSYERLGGAYRSNIGRMVGQEPMDMMLFDENDPLHVS